MAYQVEVEFIQSLVLNMAINWIDFIDLFQEQRKLHQTIIEIIKQCVKEYKWGFKSGRWNTEYRKNCEVILDKCIKNYFYLEMADHMIHMVQKVVNGQN
ncbi:unnamed protein product [Paramecium sonneborni]|uniref:Uncharacterized protein n=1 Tax=Paramecium sonneborni TaxID=65129 RepID=A0A8S1RQV1_9CILI|nr:unnamed protein product [Paramecium sonneborni]